MAARPRRRSSGSYRYEVADTSLTAVASVSAASYGPALAAESIASAFGQGMALSTEAASSIPLPVSLGGAQVIVTDSGGTDRLAPLFYASPSQINYLVPAGSRTGPARVTTVTENSVSTGSAQIVRVAPGLFSANASGTGVAAAQAVRVAADNSQSLVAVFEFDAAQGKAVPVPIDLGPETDQVILVLFGTGIRGRSGLSAVHATIDGEDAPVSYAGPQGYYVGLDQVNVVLPRSLAGRGEVNTVLTADGVQANTVTFSIR